MRTEDLINPLSERGDVVCVISDDICVMMMGSFKIFSIKYFVYDFIIMHYDTN